MDITLASAFIGTSDGDTAEAILRACVHCGYCNATCPTYQLLSDERDGPRGRIYLIKQVLEGATPTRETQVHLDRCLTCLSCETTCPSGVGYGALLEIGRRVVDTAVPRPTVERAMRWGLSHGLTSPAFAPALRLGQIMRPLAPASLRAQIPLARPSGLWPERTHPRKVLLLTGCVQPALAPNINSATARVLDALGVQSVVVTEAGCCGAVHEHLGDHATAIDDIRRNIDAWWPLLVENTAEAVIVNASGCGVMVKDYGEHLKDDPAYADKARLVAERACDPVTFLQGELAGLSARVTARRSQRIAFHAPCTLQHGLHLTGQIECLLRTLGFTVDVPREANLCCGSAGTYSVLQPALSNALRERKLKHLIANQPERILSANIGCITHLQAISDVPVCHWLEFLDEAIAT
ncbi:glycolate oxidase subunit GlcF [Acidiphilium sp.]|uniref:glycolate oxidase subunit GlcF n=1 Tax=Acidiphilium sp. TaxID=527 RepID=UPI003D02EFE5